MTWCLGAVWNFCIPTNSHSWDEKRQRRRMKKTYWKTYESVSQGPPSPTKKTSFSLNAIQSATLCNSFLFFLENQNHHTFNKNPLVWPLFENHGLVPNVLGFLEESPFGFCIFGWFFRVCCLVEFWRWWILGSRNIPEIPKTLRVFKTGI